MDYLAPITRHIIAPAWAAWERSPYLRHYRRLKKTQYDTPEVIQERQWQKVEQLIDHAYRTTGFYRQRLDSVGLAPENIRSLEDLRAIPLLTKDDLRAHKEAMISEPYAKAKLIRSVTSGSTGTAVEVYHDEVSRQWKRAYTLRSDEWSGWRLGESAACMWGDPESTLRGWRGRLRNALLNRTRWIDTLKLTEESMDSFACSLRRRPPSLLFGHAHSLYMFADFLRSRDGAGFRPKGIIATSMVLHDWERTVIEDVFQCSVTNRYGCEEVSLIASQCEKHQGLHVNADGIYLEIIRADGSPTDPGELGRIVVTDLVNWAMPIIRYQIGDMASWSEQPCSCGRGLPILAKVEGRIADYVVTSKGVLVSGISLTDHFGCEVPGMAQLQIIQEEVDRFTFKIVKGPDFGQVSLDTIQSLVTDLFGDDVRHECKFVDRIPQEPSGKYRFCISKVENTFASK